MLKSFHARLLSYTLRALDCRRRRREKERERIVEGEKEQTESFRPYSTRRVYICLGYLDCGTVPPRNHYWIPFVRRGINSTWLQLHNRRKRRKFTISCWSAHTLLSAWSLLDDGNNTDERNPMNLYICMRYCCLVLVFKRTGKTGRNVINSGGQRPRYDWVYDSVSNESNRRTCYIIDNYMHTHYVVSSTALFLSLSLSLSLSLLIIVFLLYCVSYTTRYKLPSNNRDAISSFYIHT